MFVIDSYIEVNEEDRIPYKVYGIYNSKELAIKALDELNNYLQDNYGDNILYVWNFDDGFTIQFIYAEPDDVDFESDDVDFEHVAGLYYEVKEISTPDSILNTTPDNIGAVIRKITFSDND